MPRRTWDGSRRFPDGGGVFRHRPLGRYAEERTSLWEALRAKGKQTVQDLWTALGYSHEELNILESENVFITACLRRRLAQKTWVGWLQFLEAISWLKRRVPHVSFT